MKRSKEKMEITQREINEEAETEQRAKVVDTREEERVEEQREKIAQREVRTVTGDTKKDRNKRLERIDER